MESMHRSTAPRRWWCHSSSSSSIRSSRSSGSIRTRLALFGVLLMFHYVCVGGVRWANDVRLDEHFRMLWTIDGDGSGDGGGREVTFEVQVRTHGYVGLGFSTNGELAGADVAIGWIHQGQTYFQVSIVINIVCQGAVWKWITLTHTYVHGHKTGDANNSTTHAHTHTMNARCAQSFGQIIVCGQRWQREVCGMGVWWSSGSYGNKQYVCVCVHV